MIGKPEWFTYRFLGWGVRPKTKEGWLYIAVFAALASAGAEVRGTSLIQPSLESLFIKLTGRELRE